MVTPSAVALLTGLVACGPDVVEGLQPSAERDTGESNDTADMKDTAEFTRTARMLFSNLTEVAVIGSYYNDHGWGINGVALEPGRSEHWTLESDYYWFVYRESEGDRCWQTDQVWLRAGDIKSVEITTLPYVLSDDSGGVYYYCDL